MCSYKYIVFVLILIFSKLNRVCAQQNLTEILEIFDSFGIDPLDIINILDPANAEAICKDFKNTERDDLCSTQLKVICDNESFMSKMLDASSKYPYSGMLIRTRFDYGSYDECIDLDLTQNGVRVIGKHCIGGLIIPMTELNDTDFFEKAYKLSICIPDGCSAVDLLTILNVSSDLPLINDVSCTTQETSKILEAGDYAGIAFFVIIFLVMLISTLYDLYFYYTDQECPHVLLTAFSVYRNGKKLFQVSEGPSDQIKVIHGIRVITMMWIVAGHSFGTMTQYPGINTAFAIDFEWTRKSTYITAAHLGVDTFFFLSGLLLAYQYLKQDPKPLKTHIKRVPYLYLHRYLRITPPVAAAFIFVITILTHLGDGPIYYENIKLEKDRCLKYWWSFFLYTQNYVNYDNLCILTTWYLSADWQLFLISPIVVLPVAVLIKRNFRWIIGQLLFLNIFLTVAVIGLKFLLNDFSNIYETHAYINDYFIGFMVGAFIREKNDLKYQFNAMWNFVIWLTVLIMMLLMVFAYKELQLLNYYNDDSSYTAYFVLLRTFWCTGLSWIIYSCHKGYGGFINWLLTTPFVQVLSKLTYCMYITHGCPLIYFRLTSRDLLVYSQMTAIHDAIITYVFTLVLAVVWTLAFESPLIILEKHFMGRKHVTGQSTACYIKEDNSASTSSPETFTQAINVSSALPYAGLAV